MSKTVFVPFEVFVTWIGTGAMNDQFYHLQRGETGRGRIAIRPRLGTPRSVAIEPSSVEWLTIADGFPRSGVPPFETVLEVHTESLAEGQVYEDQVIVVCGSLILASKLIRVHIEQPEPPIVYEDSQSVMAQFANDVFQWTGRYARGTDEDRRALIGGGIAAFQDRAIRIADSVDSALDRVKGQARTTATGVSDKLDTVGAHYGIEHASDRAVDGVKKSVASTRQESAQVVGEAGRWFRTWRQDLLSGTKSNSDGDPSPNE